MRPYFHFFVQPSRILKREQERVTLFAESPDLVQEQQPTEHVISIMRCMAFFVILFALVRLIDMARTLVIPSLSEHLFPSSIQSFGRPSKTLRTPRRPHRTRRPSVPNLRTQSF